MAAAHHRRVAQRAVRPPPFVVVDSHRRARRRRSPLTKSSFVSPPQLNQLKTWIQQIEAMVVAKVVESNKELNFGGSILDAGSSKIKLWL